MKELKYLIGIFALTFLFSCSSTVDENDSNTENNADTLASVENNAEESNIDEDLMARFELLMVNLPLPVDILDDLKASSAKFNEDKLMQTENSKGFTNNFERSINIGFYGTDLIYVSKYEHMTDIFKYLDKLKSLTEEIGVPMAVNPEMMTRYESNQDNLDSTMVLTLEIYDKIEGILKDNGDLENAVLVNTASRIEGLYLSCVNFPMGENNENVEKLRTRIKQEANILKEAISLMNEFDDEYMKSFVAELNKIQELYANLADQNTISDDEIKKLDETIFYIRNIYNPDID